MKGVLKTLYVTLVLILGLVTFVYSNCACMPPHTEVSTSNGALYDTCTKSGTYKSNSICYTDTRVMPAPGKIVPPYQFYTCVPYGSSFILYPRNCTGPYSVIEDTVVPIVTGEHLIFNAYNEATGKCDLVNPLPVPDPGLNATTPAPTAGWPFCIPA